MNDFIDIYVHMYAMIAIIGFSVFYSVMIIMCDNVMFFFKIIAVIIIIAAFYVASNRNTYLPFLGKTVVPPILFQQEITPEGATEVFVIHLDKNIEDGTRLIYWGAESTNKNNIRTDPFEAYGNYSNTGITTVSDSKATVYFHCPDIYKAGTIYKKTIDRHIHYRLISPNSAMMSQVFTAYVQC